MCVRGGGGGGGVKGARRRARVTREPGAVEKVGRSVGIKSQ